MNVHVQKYVRLCGRLRIADGHLSISSYNIPN